MALIRSLLYYAGSVPVMIVIVVLAPLTLLLPYALRARWISLWPRFDLIWIRLTCGLKYRMSGLEQIPPGPVVFLIKHQSAWETIALQALWPEIAWVVKRELYRVPFFGWGLALVKPIAINRSSPKKALQEVLSQGQVLLNSGRRVALFPEGTRTAPGQPGRYNRSGAALAKAAGVPVVPVAHNAGEFWPKNSIIKRSGTIELLFGPVIDSSRLTAAEISKTAELWIEKEVARISTRPLPAPVDSH